MALLERPEKTVFIEELEQNTGQKVQLKGWIYNFRSSGKVRFLVLRDGSGMCQCVLSYNEKTKHLFSVFEKLTLECAVEVEGLVKEWKNNFEIEVLNLKILSSSPPYPISKKEHGIDFLMNRRHLWLRSKRPHAVLRLRHFIIQACHVFFEKKNFTRIDPPIFTPTACEGTSTLFQVKDDSKDPFYLSQSGQMYLEAASSAFNRVYCLSPVFRAEKSSTRRHLMEFWMLEAEMAFLNLNQNMELIEELVVFVVEYALKKAQKELKTLERCTDSLKKIKTPFTRLYYEEAANLIMKKNPQFKKGEDFGGADETVLSSHFNGPVFVHHYPKNIKAFYMKTSEDSKNSLSCDLLAPEGYGELVGGGQREDNFETLKTSAAELGLDAKDLNWYLDLRKYGSFTHSGFGLGLERMISWIAGLDHVREAIPFPRVYGRKFFEHATS